MRTDDLIHALVADLTVSKTRLWQLFAVALALGAAVSAAAFFSTMGPRADFTQALHTIRFVLKFVLTLSLATTAAGLLMRLARPGAPLGWWRWAWLATPLMLVVAVAVELAVIPPDSWAPRLIGVNARYCLMLIPLLSIAPLAGIVFALRQGAPTRPGLAGAVAGLAAGGIAATLYASHCTDDSPLFVATWYSLAIGIVALFGYVAGARWLRW
jgi:hypothetical protein